MTGTLPHFQDDSVDFSGVFKYADTNVGITTYYVNTTAFYGYARVGFRASLQVPVANENRPVNIAVRYLIRAAR